MGMEQTLKLARQADIRFTSTLFEGSGILQAKVTEYDLNNFADQVLKECYIALQPMLRDMISRGHAQRLIQKHFEADTDLKQGDRVNVIAGFNVGAKGVINYIDPTGKIWVRRKGASTDVFYTAEELELDHTPIDKYSDIVSDGGLDPRNKFDVPRPLFADVVKYIETIENDSRNHISYMVKKKFGGEANN